MRDDIASSKVYRLNQVRSNYHVPFFLNLKACLTGSPFFELWWYMSGDSVKTPAMVINAKRQLLFSFTFNKKIHHAFPL
jgi:hypothetical protein